MLELNKIYQWDCLETMKQMSDNSVDAIVTDPPYWLSFMGKKRDYDVPSQEIREEALRVLKPWWYLLAFAGTRTQHRMAVRIEDAWFEIRDMIAWVYGSWFPKSLNIGKAIDKLQGNKREILGLKKYAWPSWNNRNFWVGNDDENYTKRIDTKWNSEREWRWTALKPALEPITVARKPLWEKTVAENVLKWWTGGINIDWCRVEGNWVWSDTRHNKADNNVYGKYNQITTEQSHLWRFPANLIHDWSDEVVELFPESKVSGAAKNGRVNLSGKDYSNDDNIFGGGLGQKTGTLHNDSGSASRFFYCAKSSKSERNMWCEELEEKQYSYDGRETPIENAYQRNESVAKNNHPTVKPIALMEYLIKLVTKQWAIVLDPFAWSGSTLVACKKLKRQYIGCEMTEEYIPIIKARLESIREREKSLFEQI